MMAVTSHSPVSNGLWRCSIFLNVKETASARSQQETLASQKYKGSQRGEHFIQLFPLESKRGILAVPGELPALGEGSQRVWVGALCGWIKEILKFRGTMRAC